MLITSSNSSDFNAPARRIVSVVPSQTELLYTLGLEEEVIGITKFCIHPETWFRSKKRIGGTKVLKLDEIRALQPDLIIANKEENTQWEIETLANEFPLYMSDIYSLEDAFQTIGDIGALTGKETKAMHLIDSVRSAFIELKSDISRKVLYLIWRDPYMAAGQNTFINAMMECCGWKNALPISNEKDYTRYPELNFEEISNINPEVILLSSEPYPFRQKHIDELQVLCPESKIILVDGELFSWYGSRLKFSPAHFTAVIERLRYFRGD